MKKIFFFFATILLYFTPLMWKGAGGEVHAQNPLVKQWDKRFGCDTTEILISLQPTTDGGCILGGYTFSGNGCDISQNNWDLTFQTADYWIIKVDASGNKQWEKRYGGNDNDVLTSLQQTKDGGYILGGYSASPYSGDKTQNRHGYRDYWIVKTDSSGVKLWDNAYGGSLYNDLYSLQQTTDGGYILGGSSNSDSSGEKSQPTYGMSDYWIIKIDSLGQKQWDKDLGGTLQESFRSITQTADGGYVAAGWSRSNADGVKTQPNFGNRDYWAVKMDSVGNMLWDSNLGGTGWDDLFVVRETPDSGCIVGGISYTYLDGNKTAAGCSINGSDYWFIKINASGATEWQKILGGIKTEDDFGSISPTKDGGYLVSGTSYTNIIGCDKSENNLGYEQTWVIKTDSLLNKQWDKTVFTLGHDEQGLAVQTTDGCFLFANFTTEGVGGYKTQNNWDWSKQTPDFWVVKFCDTTLTSIAEHQNESFIVTANPNPFADWLTISLAAKANAQAIATLNDVFGRQVLAQTIPSKNFRLNTHSLASGIYFLEVTVAGKRVVQKVIK